MTRDDIIKLAQECQLIGMRPHLDGIYQDSLERFANFVAAAEREACAKVCDLETALWEENSDGQVSLRSVAAVIRARGKA